MSEQRAAYTTTYEKPKMWELESRTTSGTFVISRSGALLFRIEIASGLIFLWDKKAGVEVPINIFELPFKFG